MPINTDYYVVPVGISTENSNNPKQASDVCSNNLVRSPKTDELVGKSRKKLSFKEMLTSSLKKSIQKHEVEKLSKKYADLITRLPEVQKTFQTVFMRDDLTERDTLNMLQEYHKTELIKIKGTPEEYARALFNLAVKNYGLEHAGIKLEFEPPNNSKAAGGWTANRGTVTCKANKSADEYFTIIHHELRHAKQTQAVVENSSDEEYKDYFKRLCYRCAKNDGHVKNINSYEEFEQRILTPDFLKIVMKPSKKLARKNPQITEESKEFAMRMLEAEKNYTDCDTDMTAYWNADNEKDARFAEIEMVKLFGINKSRINYYNDMDKKYLIN